MKLLITLLLCLSVLATAATKAKDPAVAARKEFVVHYQQTLKSAGWMVNVEQDDMSAYHDGPEIWLEIRFTNTSPEETHRFVSEQVVPRKYELRHLGFTEVVLSAQDKHGNTETIPKWANTDTFNDHCMWNISLGVVEEHAYPFAAKSEYKSVRSDAAAHITTAEGSTDAYCYTVGSSLNCSDRPWGGVYVTLPDAGQKVECCVPARAIDKACATNNRDNSIECDHLEINILEGRAATFPYRRARIQDDPPCYGCKQSDTLWDAFCVPSFKDVLDQQHERCYIAGRANPENAP